MPAGFLPGLLRVRGPFALGAPVGMGVPRAGVLFLLSPSELFEGGIYVYTVKRAVP